MSYGPGDRAPAVAVVRELLGRAGVLVPGLATGDPEHYDGDVELAVRAFQQQRGLLVDGVVGPATYRRLDEARWRLGDRILTHLPGDLMAGDDVYTLQQRMLDLGFDTGRVDGYFGARTEAALRDVQRNLGLPPNGTCGPATLAALERLRPRVSGGAPNALRMGERIRDAGPQLTGKTVVIDPGRGEHLAPRYVDHADRVIHDLASRIEGRLVAIGVQAYLSGPPSEDPAPEAERAGFANSTRANLCVSLCTDASDQPDAAGVATYFFGAAHHGAVSSAGERLAGLVQREIVARTDLADLRTHAKSWDLLRLTRMPAVRVDVGYLSNAGDRQRLASSAFRDTVAEAVVVAVQRFYLSADADAPTGVLRLSELRAGLAAQAGRGAPDAAAAAPGRPPAQPAS